MPSLNMPVQTLKVAILPLDLPCSGTVTYSREILTTGKFHGKKPDRFSLKSSVGCNTYFVLNCMVSHPLTCYKYSHGLLTRSLYKHLAVKHYFVTIIVACGTK